MSKLIVTGDGRLILEDDNGEQRYLESGVFSLEGFDASKISPVYMGPPANAASETFEDLLDAYARDTASQSMTAAQHERALILAHVARLEARQITPEIIALYQRYAVMRFEEDEYPSEYENLERDMLYKLFALIDPERWKGYAE